MFDIPELEEAFVLFSGNDTEKAMRLTEDFIRDNPKEVLGYSLLGVILSTKNEFDRALQLLDAAISLDPSRASLYTNKAAILQIAQRIPEAIETYGHAISLDPEDHSSYKNLFMIYRDLGNKEKENFYLQKYQALESMAAKDETSFSLSVRGENPALPPEVESVKDDLIETDILITEKKYAEAETGLKALLKKVSFASAREHILFTLGNVLYRQKKTDEAYGFLRQVLDLNPKHKNARHGYAEISSKRGDFKTAFDLLFGLIADFPDDEAIKTTLHNTIYVTELKGARGTAIAALERWRTLDPENPLMRHLAASFGREEAPEKASNAYVVSTFDGFSKNFEETLAALEYKIPALLGEIVSSLSLPSTSQTVLDLGCGTGLMAPYLKPYSKRLDGVDLSPKMLEKAAEKKAYDLLAAEDIVSFCKTYKGMYSLMTAADVLVYFGVLKDLFESVVKILEPGGYFLFSVEKGAEEKSYELQDHGRYRHAPSYLEAELKAAGFEIVVQKDAVGRKENMKGVSHLLILARRA